MKALLNANGKLEKIMNSDGVAAPKISGDAWKALSEESQGEWNSRAMGMKVNALNSIEGKSYLREKCIDELTAISNQADELEIVFLYFMKTLNSNQVAEPAADTIFERVHMSHNVFGSAFAAYLLSRKELINFDGLTSECIADDCISTEDSKKI